MRGSDDGATVLEILGSSGPRLGDPAQAAPVGSPGGARPRQRTALHRECKPVDLPTIARSASG
eukprot:13960452-Alexandrium_andersonii.AAC.1